MTSQSTLTLTSVASRIAHRWPTLLSCVLIFTGLALGFSFAAQVQYEATAVVRVAPITSNPFDVPSNQQVNLITEREVVQSTEVAERVAAAVGSSTEALLSSVEVAAPPNSQVLSISVRASSPAAAAQRANAFAETYLEVRTEDAQGVAQQLIDTLEVRVEELLAQLESDDDSAVSAAEQQIASLREEQANLSTVAVNPGRVISPANEPQGPASLGVLVLAVAGATFGFLAGCGLALLQDRMDRRIHDAARLRDMVRPTKVVDVRSPQDPLEPYRRALVYLDVQADQRPRAPTTAVGELTAGPSWRSKSAKMPVVVVVVSAMPGHGSGMVRRLHRAAMTTGEPVSLITDGLALEDLDELDLTESASAGRWETGRVIVDATRMRRSHALELVAKADVAVLVVSRNEAWREVRDTIDEIHEVRGGLDLVLCGDQRHTTSVEVSTSNEASRPRRADRHAKASRRRQDRSGEGTGNATTDARIAGAKDG